MNNCISIIFPNFSPACFRSEFGRFSEDEKKIKPHTQVILLVISISIILPGNIHTTTFHLECLVRTSAVDDYFMSEL